MRRRAEPYHSAGTCRAWRADEADAELNEDWGVAVTSLDSVLPEGWIEPRVDSVTPAGYLTKLLSEIQDQYYPARSQLQVLAVLVEHLDTAKIQEFAGTPWNERVQLAILLFGHWGGAAKRG